MTPPINPEDIDTTEPKDLYERMAAPADVRNEDNIKTNDMRVPMSRVKSPFDRESHGKDDVIDVHFDGVSWCIEDSSLDKDLEFTHLADAEARASELSKETGRSVCVHGQDGELIDSFKTKAK